VVFPDFDMEALTDLLFELSNDDRLKILQDLEKGPKNLTRVAKTLGLSVQETSRNVARLVQTSLVARNTDGDYTLTPYGDVSLKLLSSYRFISENKQYFLTHDASVLPYHFLDRLGELTVYSLQEDFVTNYILEGEMLKQAEEYAYATGTQFNVNAQPMVEEKVNIGVEIRTILPENIVPPIGFTPSSGPDRRLLPKVQIAITVTDKRAFFGLPLLDGKFDSGSRFVSEDPKFRKWCLDLFNYYWDQTKPLMGSVTNLS
jgi:predicted transcriptional regulator